MRTTLKRGTAGHVAGNGHGGIPISPLTGATRYRTKRRGPLRLLGKFFLWLVMIVLVAAGALAGGAWLYINESVAEVRAHTRELIDAQQDLDVPTPDQPTVALVISGQASPMLRKELEARGFRVTDRAEPGPLK